MVVSNVTIAALTSMDVDVDLYSSCYSSCKHHCTTVSPPSPPRPLQYFGMCSNQRLKLHETHWQVIESQWSPRHPRGKSWSCGDCSLNRWWGCCCRRRDRWCRCCCCGRMLGWIGLCLWWPSCFCNFIFCR